MTFFEVMALFSFSFILISVIGVFILGFISVRKKKKAIEKINDSCPDLKEMEDFVISLRSMGNKYEIKEDNQII